MFGSKAHSNMQVLARDPPKLEQGLEHQLLQELRVKLGPYADSARLLYHIRITRGKLHWSVNSYLRDVLAEVLPPGTPYDFQPKRAHAGGGLTGNTSMHQQARQEGPQQQQQQQEAVSLAPHTFAPLPSCVLMPPPPPRWPANHPAPSPLPSPTSATLLPSHSCTHSHPPNSPLLQAQTASAHTGSLLHSPTASAHSLTTVCPLFDVPALTSTQLPAAPPAAGTPHEGSTAMDLVGSPGQDSLNVPALPSSQPSAALPAAGTPHEGPTAMDLVGSPGQDSLDAPVLQLPSTASGNHDGWTVAADRKSTAAVMRSYTPSTPGAQGLTGGSGSNCSCSSSSDSTKTYTVLHANSRGASGACARGPLALNCSSSSSCSSRCSGGAGGCAGSLCKTALPHASSNECAAGLCSSLGESRGASGPGYVGCAGSGVSINSSDGPWVRGSGGSADKSSGTGTTSFPEVRDGGERGADGSRCATQCGIGGGGGLSSGSSVKDGTGNAPNVSGHNPLKTQGTIQELPRSRPAFGPSTDSSSRGGAHSGQLGVKWGALPGGGGGGSSRGHLVALPLGVLEDVLAHCMHPASLCAAACASRVMHQAATSNAVWERLYVARWGRTRFPLEPLTAAASLPTWGTTGGFAVAMGMGQGGATGTQQQQQQQQQLQEVGVGAGTAVGVQPQSTAQQQNTVGAWGPAAESTGCRNPRDCSTGMDPSSSGTSTIQEGYRREVSGELAQQAGSNGVQSARTLGAPVVSQQGGSQGQRATAPHPFASAPCPPPGQTSASTQATAPTAAAVVPPPLPSALSEPSSLMYNTANTLSDPKPPAHLNHPKQQSPPHKQAAGQEGSMLTPRAPEQETPLVPASSVPSSIPCSSRSPAPAPPPLVPPSDKPPGSQTQAGYTEPQGGPEAPLPLQPQVPHSAGCECWSTTHQDVDANAARACPDTAHPPNTTSATLCWCNTHQAVGANAASPHSGAAHPPNAASAAATHTHNSTATATQATLSCAVAHPATHAHNAASLLNCAAHPGAFAHTSTASHPPSTGTCNQPNSSRPLQPSAAAAAAGSFACAHLPNARLLQPSTAIPPSTTQPSYLSSSLPSTAAVMPLLPTSTALPSHDTHPSAAHLPQTSTLPSPAAAPPVAAASRKADPTLQPVESRVGQPPVSWIQAYKEQASYAAHSRCPLCGAGRVVPIVYGYPSSKLLEGMRLFQLILGGDHLIEDCHCWACCGCNASFRSYPYENTHLWQQDLAEQRTQAARAAASQQNGAPNMVHLPTYTYEL